MQRVRRDQKFESAMHMPADGRELSMGNSLQAAKSERTSILGIKRTRMRGARYECLRRKASRLAADSKKYVVPLTSALTAERSST